MKISLKLLICLVMPLSVFPLGCRAGTYGAMNSVAFKASDEAAQRGFVSEGADKAVLEPAASGPSMDGPAQTERLMIYNGFITVVIETIPEGMETLKAITKKAGGYMQSMTGTSMVVKIPAPRFQEVVAEVERMGEVTAREITSRDVTEEMRDLGIRLSNAEEMRKRLIALLDRAETVKDSIRIEKELSRTTETIELYKGKIRALDNQIAYSTLTVHFNASLSQQVIRAEIPFPWVRDLAGDMIRGEVMQATKFTRSSGLDFDLPASFALYHEYRDLVRATSAEGVLIKVQRHDNVEGGDLEFWKRFIRRALTAKRAIAVKESRDIKIVSDVDGVILEGVKTLGGQKTLYLVAVALTEDDVYTYEAWGPEAEFDKMRPAVEESIQSLDILSIFQKILGWF